MSYIDKNYNFNHITIKVGTDCSGIESPIIALKLLGVNVIHAFSCDCNLKVRQLIEKYYKPTFFYDNIFNRDHSKLPDIDLYICGFSCRPFSALGKKQGTSIREGTIFFECVEVIRLKRPKWFLLENIYSLITHHKETYELIKTKLSELKDYSITYNILNTCDYGVPQHRRRLYIIGTRNDMPYFTPHRKIPTVNIDYYIDQHLPPNNEKCLIPRRQKVLDHMTQKKGIKWDEDWIITLGDSIQYSRARKDCCLAITTNSRFLYLTSKKRFLCLKELCYLQGLTDKYIYDEYDYSMIGNMMSVNVLYYIFVSLYN